MKLIEFLQANWLTIVLVITAIIVVLQAYANLKVRLAKITPEKEDDMKAGIFKAKVNAFVQFLKDIFIPKKKNDKGFAHPYFAAGLAGLVIGVLITAAIAKTYYKPETKVEVREVEKIVYAEASKKSENLHKVTKVTTKADGSSETVIEEKSKNEEGKLVFQDTETYDQKLGVYFGTGTNTDTFRDLQLKIKPLGSIIVTYNNYAASVISDFKKDHAAFLYYGWRF